MTGNARKAIPFCPDSGLVLPSSVDRFLTGAALFWPLRG